MRKFAGLFVFVFLGFGVVWSQSQEKIKFLPDEEKYVTVAVNGGVFFAQDEVLRELYGNNLPCFGGEVGFRFPVRDPHGLDVAVGGRLLRAKGLTSYTEEEIRLRLNNLSFSIRYSYDSGRFALFVGPGMDYVMYKETYAETFPVEFVEGNQAGFHVIGGGYYHLSSALSLRGYFKYGMAETDKEGVRVNLGGTEWGISLMLRFYL
jgi:hypothetical protein